MENLIVPLIFVSIPLFGYLVLTAIARGSGWSRFAASYPAKTDSTIKNRYFCSVWVNTFPFKAVINVGGNERGLYMSSILPGFGSFFVPWSEVYVKEKGRHLFMVYELKFEKTGNDFIQISPLLANRLRQWAGDAWPVETTTSRF
jgi:hypothetical protein